MASLSLNTSIIFFTNIPQRRRRSTIMRPLDAITQEELGLRVSYDLKKEQSRLFHKLPSGLNMEVIYQEGVKHKALDEGKDKSENPPLVFIHGSFHAAWCWAEHWLPYFSQNGFDCYALSLLGQGESDAPAGTVAGTLQTHAADVADFIQKELKSSPVLVGHSFGGLIVQSYIANVSKDKSRGTKSSLYVFTGNDTNHIYRSTNLKYENGSLHPYLAGAVLVCSVPPSGNGLVWRYLFSKPTAAFKVTRSLAAKAFQTCLPLCRETFFSSTMDDSLVLRYQKLMKESSRMPLFDLRKLNASLPVPPLANPSLEVFILGAKDDFIVDMEGLQETGRFYGIPPVCIEGVAHDIMIDCSWEKGAHVLLSWLSRLEKVDTNMDCCT